ncbi:TPA: hypothetical protein DCR79_01555 [Patescibacteria group bacterium]|nr:hypothetical protein [Patescibacteria group bacterium]
MPEDNFSVKLIAYVPNARNNAQRAECEKAQRDQQCPFCPSGSALNSLDDPVIFESDHWNVKKNAYPYPGVGVHLVIIPKAHITSVSELSDAAILELVHVVVPWAEKEFNLPGYGLVVRTNPAVTGGTIYHLHFQLVLAKVGETVNVPFGPRRE